MNRPLFSIVSPIYRSAKTLSLLVSEIKKNVEPISSNFEILLVEDGSPDSSWDAIVQESRKDSRVKGIKLSRNFGQHYAITAGLDYAQGQWTIVMDCDLQDNPSEIPNLFKKAEEGHKIVLARREARKDGLRKKLSSRVFYKVLSVLTGVKQDSSIANYGIYHRDVISAIIKMREPFRNFAAIVKWVGFAPVTINVRHSRREEGTSTYNLQKLFKLAMDTILAYSNKPLYYIVGLGFAISLISFLSSIIVFVKYITGSITVMGYTSLILSIWILGGLMMMFLGIVGLYIGKMFEGIKSRPIYIISETTNLITTNEQLH
jgi:polyisoprenyl-phosphate glycosyltransferase